MGDHRIELKLKFEMHGHTDKWECWLNWSDDLPERVKKWVEDNYQKAMAKYCDQQYKYEELQRAESEQKERDELARLKAKYDPV